MYTVSKTSTFYFWNNSVKNQRILITFWYKIVKKFGISVYEIAHHTCSTLKFNDNVHGAVLMTTVTARVHSVYLMNAN